MLSTNLISCVIRTLNLTPAHLQIRCVSISNFVNGSCCKQPLTSTIYSGKNCSKYGLMRARSFTKGAETNGIHDDDVDSDSQRRNNSVKEVTGTRTLDLKRIRAKLNWKNSLTSVDSINLLENLYKLYPELVEYDKENLIEYLQRMSLYSFDVEKAAAMQIIYPRLMSIPENKLVKCLNTLITIGLNEKQRLSILRRAPNLIEVSPKKLINQFSFLKQYFSLQETLDILSKSVELFTESESTLKKKLEYLIKDMSHETKHIVTCKALSYSMKHLKTRHELLIRTGLFVPIPYSKFIKVMEKEYNNGKKPRSKYFKPIEVVCYKDEDFLKLCTNGQITLNELAAFEELYAAELEALDEDDDDEYDHEADDDTSDTTHELNQKIQ